MKTASRSGRNVEYSIIRCSELGGARRFDAEYYEPKYLENERILKNYANGYYELQTILKDKNGLVGGATPLGANYLKKDGIKFIRVQNVMENFLDLSNLVYIDSTTHNGLLKRSRLQPNDVLLTITGVTYGKSATVPKSLGKANINQHSVRIVLNSELILPYFLSTFLNCKFGKNQSDRRITGLSRPGLVYSELRTIVIPRVDMKLQMRVQKLVAYADKLLDQSKDLYHKAETTLLEELNLKDWKPSTKKIIVGGTEIEEEENISIHNALEVLTTGRMDAEYFQPACDSLLKTFDGRLELRPLQKLLIDFQKGVEVGSEQYQEGGKPFIRVSNLSTHGLVDRDQKYINTDLYAELKATFEPVVGDLLLTKDATPGVAYLVKDPVEGIISGGILKLKVNEDAIDGEYLAICINSIVGRSQIDRDGGGSVITHWRPEQIKKLRIPLLLQKTQQSIASLVQQSHKARVKAMKLLEIAKKSVEIAIEQDEVKGLNYLKEEVEKIKENEAKTENK